MHELSICFNIIETLNDIVKQNELTEIDTIVLEVGELTSIVPEYLKKCFPAAVDNTIFQNSKIQLEVVKGVGRCSKCHNIYDLLPVDGFCPQCSLKAFTVISGQEFSIKEIVAR